MEKEDFKEVLLQVLELQLDYQLRAIRQLQGKPETEPVLARPRGRRRQSLVDLSVKILTEEGEASARQRTRRITAAALRTSRRPGHAVQCFGEESTPGHSAPSERSCHLHSYRFQGG